MDVANIQIIVVVTVAMTTPHDLLYYWVTLSCCYRVSLALVRGGQMRHLPLITVTMHARSYHDAGSSLEAISVLSPSVSSEPQEKADTVGGSSYQQSRHRPRAWQQRRLACGAATTLKMLTPQQRALIAAWAALQASYRRRLF